MPWTPHYSLVEAPRTSCLKILDLIEAPWKHTHGNPVESHCLSHGRPAEAPWRSVHESTMETSQVNRTLLITSKLKSNASPMKAQGEHH